MVNTNKTRTSQGWLVAAPAMAAAPSGDLAGMHTAAITAGSDARIVEVPDRTDAVRPVARTVPFDVSRRGTDTVGVGGLLRGPRPEWMPRATAVQVNEFTDAATSPFRNAFDVAGVPRGVDRMVLGAVGGGALAGAAGAIAGGVGGAVGGGVAGAAIGAAIGGAVGAVTTLGAGTVPGAIIGGVIGAGVGAAAWSAIGAGAGAVSGAAVGAEVGALGA
ncbi:hypothetical protein [Nocardia alni]|uniref:hypothetical protein n=1 Tax=Nocardia alni TaxID=2815723 RepID=UPI001C217E6B|nr:hypothetical protein [Nocardia alni]